MVNRIVAAQHTVCTLCSCYAATRQLNLYTISQDDFEHQMNFEHRTCMAHSIKTDKVSRLHYIFNHASAERIRYLRKCHSFSCF